MATKDSKEGVANGKWLDKRSDGVVAVDLYRYGEYKTSDKGYFSCVTGIMNETGLGCRYLTFVISKNKPKDGICLPIFKDTVEDVSFKMIEAYETAAGENSRAWYWVEH